MGAVQSMRSATLEDWGSSSRVSVVGSSQGGHGARAWPEGTADTARRGTSHLREEMESGS